MYVELLETVLNVSRLCRGIAEERVLRNRLQQTSTLVVQRTSAQERALHV